MSGLLSLKWNNHSRIFLNLLQNLRDKELYCDTTIVCQGKMFPVHKLVLSTCSEYFKEIFERSQCKHPFIILRDVQPLELEALLNYMYKGEVDVLQDTLSELVKTAEALQIKGLAVPDDEAQDFATQVEQANSSQDSYEEQSRVIASQESEPDRVHYEPADPLKEDNGPNENTNHHQSHEENLISTRVQASPRSNSPNDDELLNENLLKVEFNEGPDDGYLNKSVDANSLIPIEEDLSFNSSNVDGDLSWNELPEAAGPSGEQKPVVQDVKVKKKPGTERKSVYDHLLHSNLNPRRVGNVFTCPVCGLGSTHRTSMKRHILRKHTMERPFGCEYCTYRAATKDTVREHTIRLHTNNMFQCTHCSFNTKLKRFLMRHIKKVHQIIPTSPLEVRLGS